MYNTEYHHHRSRAADAKSRDAMHAPKMRVSSVPHVADEWGLRHDAPFDTQRVYGDTIRSRRR